MSTSSTSSMLPHPSHPLLDRLWADYARDVPYVGTFVSLCARFGDGTFENDHIALRSLARPREGIARTAPIFERLGWRQAGTYSFPDVHLRAVHLSQPGLPRIFISELDATALPSAARDALEHMPLAPPPPDRIEELARWFCAPARVVRADIEAVLPHSQYGAWLLAFDRRVNHFTAHVDDVALWQQRMTDAGVPMKDAIEGEPGADLRQTATQATPVSVSCTDGSSRMMPYAYFEIAERRNAFDGFLAPQARQLFDMTTTGRST
jgi:hypothetical protein